MFARLKESGGRVYLVIVESRRHHVGLATTVHKQREVARLGRVDHLSPAGQGKLAEAMTALLSDVQQTRGMRAVEEREASDRRLRDAVRDVALPSTIPPKRPITPDDGTTEKRGRGSARKVRGKKRRTAKV